MNIRSIVFHTSLMYIIVILKSSERRGQMEMNKDFLLKMSFSNHLFVSNKEIIIIDSEDLPPVNYKILR